MNKHGKKVHKNLRRFIREETTVTFIKSFTKSKERASSYKGEDGVLVQHRAVVKVIKKLMKEQNTDIISADTVAAIVKKKKK